MNHELNDSDDQTSGISDDEDKDFYPSESESDHDIPDFLHYGHVYTFRRSKKVARN
jgi:hypothetical protein